MDAGFLVKWQELLTVLSGYVPNANNDQPIYMLEPSSLYSV